MLKRIKNFALYGDTDMESYNAIRNKIEEYNRIMALLFASVATVLISIMLVLSYSQEGFSGSKPVYVFGIVFSIVQIILSLLARKLPSLSYFSVYMALSVFLIYGIAIATLTRPEEQTVTFMVMLIFVPLIFVDRPLRMAVSLIAYIIAFIFMAIHTKTGSILAVDITDAIIFGVLAVISETVVYSSKIKGYVLENRLHIMSETDQLTGLNNRNCYELKLPMYHTMYHDTICCIYIDVNGLHELNNTKGHKAGDEMLCSIADIVMEQFGKNDVYRIGGDEYVAFELDVSEDEVKEKLSRITNQMEEQGYHAAIGCEFCKKKDVDVNDLIVAAETKMYGKKSKYYHDHNGRWTRKR